MGNISAVHYRLGRYEAAIGAAELALNLQHDSSKRQGLLLRKVYSHLYLMDLKSARESAALLEESPERATIFQRCKIYERPLETIKTIRNKLIADLPRYRPNL